MTKPQDEYGERIERLEAENERLRAVIKDTREAIEQRGAKGPGSIDFDGILARLRAALR
jgi:sugar phosphate isomerase/epimerase